MKYLLKTVLMYSLAMIMMFCASCSAEDKPETVSLNMLQEQDNQTEVFEFETQEIQPIESNPYIFTVDLSAGGDIKVPVFIQRPDLDETSTPDDIINSVLDSPIQIANIENEELVEASSIFTDDWHNVKGEISLNEGYVNFIAENQNLGEEMSANFSFSGINKHAFELGGMENSLNCGILIKVRFKDIANDNIELIYENGFYAYAGFENRDNCMYLKTGKDDIQYDIDVKGEQIDFINDEWYYFFVALDENYVYKYLIWQENNPGNNAFYVCDLYEIYKDTPQNGDCLNSNIALWSLNDVISFDVQSVKIYDFSNSDEETEGQTVTCNFKYTNDYEKYKLATILFNEGNYYNAYLLLKELNGYSTSDSYLKECERLLQTVNITDIDVANRIAYALKEQDLKVYDYLYIYQAEKIESLNLSQCKIEDLSVMTYFKNLKKLYLDGCGLSDLMPLKDMYSLEKLSLAENNIIDTLPLYNLVNLQQLDLSNNLIEDVYGLSNLKSLTVLNLSGNNLVFLDGLYNLEKLETVDLSNNFIYSVNALNNSGVKNLNILNTNITGFGAVGDMELLQELKAGFKYLWKFDAGDYMLTKKYEKDDNFHIGMSGAIHLTHMENLHTRFLSSQYNSVPYCGDLAVREVTIEMLDIPEYDEYFIENMKDIHALDDIVCKQNLIINVSDIGLTEIEIKVPKYVRNLYIHSDSKEKIEIRLYCFDCTGLERIVVGNIYISADDKDGFGSGSFILEDLDGLTDCINLKELFINSAELEDISGIADCDKLEIIHFRNNNITDISALQGKVYLKELDLSGNRIESRDVLESCIRLERYNGTNVR